LLKFNDLRFGALLDQRNWHRDIARRKAFGAEWGSPGKGVGESKDGHPKGKEGLHVARRAAKSELCC
jgi:hypothetical protein